MKRTVVAVVLSLAACATSNPRKASLEEIPALPSFRLQNDDGVIHETS